MNNIDRLEDLGDLEGKSVLVRADFNVPIADGEITDDLRPAVLSLAVGSPIENGVRLIAELGTQPRAARVSEVLSALDPPLAEDKVLRLHQWIQTDDGQRADPMTVSAASSAPLEVSA